MIKNEDMISVLNRYNGHTGYALPDDRIQRDFGPFERRDIQFIELKHLANIPGGRVILENYFVIENEEALKELLGEVEPEYHYSADDVKKILLYGTMDEFLDFLDFAPDAEIDIVKELAVKLEVSDIRKRDAIYNKTGFNVTKAIELNKEDENTTAPINVKPARRAASATTETTTTTARRTAAPVTNK